MPHVRGGAPTVFHLWCMGPTVSKLQYRVPPGRVEIGRFDHHGLHEKTVARFHLKKLGSAELVLLQRINLVLRDDAHKLAISIVETRLRWRVCIVPVVDEEFGIGTYCHLVGPFAGCYAFQISAIEFDAIRLWRNGAVLGSCKIKETLVFIDALEGTHFPAAICHLLQQLSIRTVMIKMVPTGALALPKKRAIL